MHPTTETLLKDLLALRLRDLQFSTEGRKALRHTLSVARYRLETYEKTLDKALGMCNVKPTEMTLVDYGGEHGLPAILAKRVGVGRVIYVGDGSDVFRTVGVLTEVLGAGPDVMVGGGVEGLSEWCRSNGVRPDVLVGEGVLERVYVVDAFFGKVHLVSPTMKMVFINSATPYNRRVVRRLHRAMQRAEEGSARGKGYRQLRYDHIKRIYPDMSEREALQWAKDTRGLTYGDLERAVEAQSPNLLLDSYNTCDPASGRWEKRLLPVNDYRQILAPYGLKLTVLPGRCDDTGRGPAAWAARRRNRRIDKAPDSEPVGFSQRRRMHKALKKAPFIYCLIA